MPTAPSVTWNIPPHLTARPISLIDYPIADTVTDTLVNATTWKSVWTKHGKIVERELETIAADGKSIPRNRSREG